MKIKILVLTAILTLACAANSFAAAGFNWLATGAGASTSGGNQSVTVTTGNPAFSFRNSAGVVTGYNAGTAGVSYTVVAYHMSGSFAYATSSVDTSIFRKENVAAGGNATQQNVTDLTIPAAPTDANAGPAMGALWTQNAWTASK